LFLEKFQQINSIERIIEELKEERKTREEALERRHRENIEMRNKFLESLDKLINILKK